MKAFQWLFPNFIHIPLHFCLNPLNLTNIRILFVETVFSDVNMLNKCFHISPKYFPNWYLYLVSTSELKCSCTVYLVDSGILGNFTWWFDVMDEFGENNEGGTYNDFLPLPLRSGVLTACIRDSSNASVII